MKKVRMGIIGIGNMGSAHAKALFQGKAVGLELTAVCDIDAERLKWAQQTFGPSVSLYTDYRLLIKDGIADAILIATPHGLHPSIAIDCFDAGLHVLTEKPAGIDIMHVRQMNEAAGKSGKVFGIMFNQRTNPLFARLKSLVEEGVLGEMKRFVWIINNWYRTQAYYDSESWRGSWKGEGGGVLINQGHHNLDIWQWITGMPSRIRAFCKYGHYHNITVEDDVTILAEYDNRASAVFISSTGEYPGTNRMEYSGSKGKAVIEEGILKLYLYEKDEREFCFSSDESCPRLDVRYEEFKPQDSGSGHIGILQNFADAILSDKPLLAPGYEGINGLSICNAAYISDWMDCWVDLPPDEELYSRMLKEKQDKEKSPIKNRNSEKPDNGYSERWQVRW